MPLGLPLPFLHARCKAHKQHDEISTYQGPYDPMTLKVKVLKLFEEELQYSC